MKRTIHFSLSIGIAFASLTLFLIKYTPLKKFLLLLPYLIILISVLIGIFLHKRMKMEKPKFSTNKIYTVEIKTREGFIIKGVLSHISIPFIFLEKAVIENGDKIDMKEEYVLHLDELCEIKVK